MHQHALVTVIDCGKRRRRAICTCGWAAKQRISLYMALGDASDHRIKAGHGLADPLVVSREMVDA
jgi:hypothetical protein